MTVSSTTNKVIVNGNDTATSFSFSPLLVFENSDLVVELADSSGVVTTLAEGTGTTNYAIVPSSSDTPYTGSITYPANVSGTKLATGSTLTMRAVVPLTQETALDNQGGYFPEVQEAAFDKLTLLVQQAQEQIGRSVKISATDADAPADLPPAALRAGQALIFNEDGDPIAGAIPDVAVSAAMQDVFQATSHAAAKAALDVAYGDLSGVPPVLRGSLGGLTLANNATTPNTKIDVAAGVCADDTGAAYLSLASGTIDCTTTGANGLDSGALANLTWYHAFAISAADGTTARLASTSLTPTMPSGYTLKRRLGSFKTDGSAHILAFIQDGDYFQWTAPVADFNGSSQGTSANLYTVSVPPGVHVRWVGNVHIGDSTQIMAAYISDPATTDLAATADSSSAPGSTVFNNFGSAHDAVMFVSGGIRTNTSAQIRGRMAPGGATSSFRLFTLGFIDTRGRFA